MTYKDIVWESNFPAEIKAKFDAEWQRIAEGTGFDNLNAIQQDYIVQWFEHTIKTALEAAQ